VYIQRKDSDDGLENDSAPASAPAPAPAPAAAKDAVELSEEDAAI
jgi:hypothetical protein